MPDGSVKTLRNWKVIEGQSNRGMTVRRVCKACNERWMGRLEEEVKPVLVPLMQGGAAGLYAQDCVTLARWFFQKAVIMDVFYRENRSHSFSPEERAAFMASATIPAGFSMFAARIEQSHPHDGLEDRPRFNDVHAASILPLLNARNREIHLAGYLLGLNRVLLFGVFNSTVWSYEADERIDDEMLRIWPPPVAIWTPLPETTQRVAEQQLRRLEAYVADRLPPDRISQRLAAPRKIDPTAEHVRPKRLPWKTGPALRDLVCAGCESIVCQGLSEDLLRQHWATAAPQLILHCPSCATANDLPVKRNQANAADRSSGLTLREA